MVKFFDINDAGHSIRCKLYYNDERSLQEIILFGHGFCGHKDNKAAERFANRVTTKYKHTAVLCFNWPCHGDDVKKKLTLTDCDMYITLVLKYVQEHYGVKRVSVYATSFGGYLFLKYLRDHGNPFRKIALRCPAVKMYHTLTNHVISEEEMEKLEKGKEVQVGFDRKIKISKPFLTELKNEDISEFDYLDYAEDILLIHGTKDEVIPYEMVQEFSERNLIELIPIDKADHRFKDPQTMETAISEIVNFFTLT